MIGEVLDVEKGDGFLRLGIAWTDVESHDESWTALKLTGDPTAMTEQVA